MLTAPQLNLIVAVVFVAWVLSLVATGTRVELSFFKPFSVITAALGAALAFFNRTAWHWRVWRRWLVRRPYLHGTWQASLQPQGGAPVLGFMVVRQTFTSLTLRLLTAESASASVSATFLTDPDGTLVLAVVYRADPRLAVRDRSQIHSGAFLLAVAEDTPSRLAGHYWTDRLTRGELVLSDRRSQLFVSYAEAQAQS
jgi:hypothetical protein